MRLFQLYNETSKGVMQFLGWKNSFCVCICFFVFLNTVKKEITLILFYVIHILFAYSFKVLIISFQLVYAVWCLLFIKETYMKVYDILGLVVHTWSNRGIFYSALYYITS